MAVHNEDDDFNNDGRFFSIPIPSEFEDTTYTTPPSPLFDTTIPRPTSAPEPTRAQQQDPRLKRARTPSNGKYDSETYASILSTLARHSRKRSASRASESGSLSALLVITNERLSQETARANALQVQNTTLEAGIRTHVTTVATLRQELAAAREELRLYKLQLETANREIARAQNVCDSVERARVDAEERAARDRDRVRRYAEQIETERAREEGYEHGLREGMTRAAGVSSWRRFVPRRVYTDPVGTVYRADGTGYVPSDSVTSSGSSSRPPSRTARKSLVPTSEIVSPTPMRAMPVPTPARPPSSAGTTRPFSRPRSQSQPPAPQVVRTPTRQESRTASRQEPRPPTRQGSTQPRQPENINVYPIPYVPSPTPSKRSIVLPPDNYIPVFDEETQSILLPPPHELAPPNPTDDAEEEVVFSPRAPQNEDYFSHEPARLTRSRRDSESRPRQAHAFPIGRTTSDASTTMSQYDLLRHGDGGGPGRSPIPNPPPSHAHSQPTEEERRRRSDELVREWQAHNMNAQDDSSGMEDGGDPRRGNPPPPGPPPPQQMQPAPVYGDRPPTRDRAQSQSHSQERHRTQSAAPRPPSVMSHQSRGPPPSGPHTKPKRIVLPTPLTTYSSSAPYVPTLKSQNLPPAPSMPVPPVQQPYTRQRTPSQAQPYQQPPAEPYQQPYQQPPPHRPRDTPNSHSTSSGSNAQPKRASIGGWVKDRLKIKRNSTSSSVPQIAIEPPVSAPPPPRRITS
ncbi:uncharacterized protein SCHCODRAFT_02604729 [Schizophyllum commune H4-8]|uniref:uncharacterized protein n=1 Tax=Schizophyllum commune (strain H4-8 / FGSC 9210) TaxID=578458 RepID=UPI00215F3883|nr:uncharacterized protein SCHCODRAFT_02604729 [Schizophyllum commune H4-8]KAI5899288.1 hypothetical protein SCHCODRAFT_02604729 [Schizophyllum commune H4-8]